MPLRLPGVRILRALAAFLAGTLVVVLAACSAAPVAPPAPAPAAVEAVRRVDRPFAGSQVMDDERTGSLTVVPRHANGALVVFVHGWSQTRRSLLEGRGPVARSLVGAGYAVLAADAELKAWGDAESVADYRALIERTTAEQGLTDVFLIGESMGGLATMQLAAALPPVRAVAAWYPVCDLRTMTQDRFRASIDAAWGTRSRSVVSPVAGSAKPMMIWASPADTVVASGTNAAVCAATARRAGAPVTVVETIGEHGDPSNFDAATILAFFERHRSPGA